MKLGQYKVLDSKYICYHLNNWNYQHNAVKLSLINQNTHGINNQKD